MWGTTKVGVRLVEGMLLVEAGERSCHVESGEDADRPARPRQDRDHVPNVVFPSAALVDGDRLTIYYGGADTVVCLAHGHLSDVLEYIGLESPASPGAAARTPSFLRHA